MATRTSRVALVHISTSFWRRSSSVMMPRRNCDSILSASFSYLSRMVPLSGGVVTSAMEMVRPDWVA